MASFDFVYKSYDLSTKHQTRDIFKKKENTSSCISGGLQSLLPGPPEMRKSVWPKGPSEAKDPAKHSNAFREDLGVTCTDSYGSYLSPEGCESS